MLHIASLFFCFDWHSFFMEDKKNLAIEIDNIGSLIKEVLPLFISNFIMMYISNAPKYAINNYYGDTIQNIYNILFMPAFVINLFSLFIFRPMLIQLATDWENRQVKNFWKSVLKVLRIISFLTILAIVGSWLLGIPVLSFLYGVVLDEYKLALVLVMCFGGVSACMTFLYYVVVIMRQQKLLFLAHIVAFFYVCFIVNRFVLNFGIIGGILTYGTTISLLVILLIIIMSRV